MSLPSDHPMLAELCALPTGAGCEGRVVAWIERWAAARPGVTIRRDPFGNLLLLRGEPAARPILFTAHLDHPAFVVHESLDTRELRAVFRGGVRPEYFPGASVVLHATAAPVEGEVIEYTPAESGDAFPSARIRLNREADAKPGDLITWNLGRSRIDGDRFSAPACDDLAGAAAALAAFDRLADDPAARSVQVLLTLAEEIGFIGAIGACQSGIITPDARVIALENSRSFAESPIGGGPIVRVGDRLSTFDPDLTYAIARIAEALGGRDESFRWQRKLMPGGACEATAYQAFGYQATCLCLALGNYHNMDEAAGRIAPEFISLSDFDGLVKLLVAIGRSLDAPDDHPPLRDRLAGRFERLRWVVER